MTLCTTTLLLARGDDGSCEFRLARYRPPAAGRKPGPCPTLQSWAKPLHNLPLARNALDDRGDEAGAVEVLLRHVEARAHGGIRRVERRLLARVVAPATSGGSPRGPEMP
jgi:hypothetical protein